MKRTAYFCAFLLALCLCACGNVSDAKVTSSPAPTMTILPEVMPVPTEEVKPDIPSVTSDDDALTTNENVASPSPMTDVSPSPALSETEASSAPALADSAAE